MTTISRILRVAARCLMTVLAVGAVTWLAFSGLHVNSSTAAFSYLLLILALAARAGLAESITASLASVVAYNYFFLPPVGTLTIADPENWVALVVFLVTAVTASQLSASARRQAKEADSREQEMHRMYEYSRALMLKDPDRTLASQATAKLTEIFGVSQACFYDADCDTATGSIGNVEPFTVDALRNVAHTGVPWSSDGSSAVAVPIALGGRRFGSLAVAGPAAPSTVALNSIAQLAAIAIETARAQQTATRMEAARQNEQLKSTLLDALAHEFKTPLTSIKAATSSLLPRPDLDNTSRELLTIVDEEADRLTSLVSDSIELAKIGTEPVSLSRSVCRADQLISAALSQLRLLIEDRPIELRLDNELPMLHIDRQLSELVLRQLIGNALKYSPPSSPIFLTAERDHNFALIRIRDAGAGIPRNEQEAIFEKFYRSPDARVRVAGTGMGLAIAREIIEAHGGRIWVESQPGEGAEFSFTLPLEET